MTTAIRHNLEKLKNWRCTDSVSYSETTKIAAFLAHERYRCFQIKLLYNLFEVAILAAVSGYLGCDFSRRVDRLKNTLDVLDVAKESSEYSSQPCCMHVIFSIGIICGLDQTDNHGQLSSCLLSRSRIFVYFLIFLTDLQFIAR